MIQVGGSDCGFFALAYFQSLVQGIQPESCQYNQEKMIHVYNESIKNKTIKIIKILKFRSKAFDYELKYNIFFGDFI